MPLPEPAVLADRLLQIIETDIVPKTRAGVAAGNKLFGAAILQKSDLSLVVAETNAETKNPLFHGEISTLNAFYKLPVERRPATAPAISCPRTSPARSASRQSPGPASTTFSTSSVTKTRATLSISRTT